MCSSTATLTDTATTSTSLLPNIHDAWFDLNPAGELPVGRHHGGMAFDPSSGRMIMFGGSYGGDNSLNETWAYDPSANRWTDLKPAGRLPTPRSGLSLVWDPSTQRMIMFGGAERTAASGCLNDTWAYDAVAGSWTELVGRNHPGQALGPGDGVRP